MAATTFRCVGRRYPNGPPQAMLGCTGRVAPRVFRVEAQDFTSRPELNGLHYCYWSEAFPAAPVDPWARAGRWLREPQAPLLGGQVRVWTIALAGVWNLRVEFRTRIPQPLGFTAETHYHLPFPDGFPAQWIPDKFTVPWTNNVSNWTVPRPDSVIVSVGLYDRIPADSCILP
jgi:hypothetical protein